MVALPDNIALCCIEDLFAEFRTVAMVRIARLWSECDSGIPLGSRYASLQFGRETASLVVAIWDYDNG